MNVYRFLPLFRPTLRFLSCLSRRRWTLAFNSYRSVQLGNFEIFVEIVDHVFGALSLSFKCFFFP